MRKLLSWPGVLLATIAIGSPAVSKHGSWTDVFLVRSAAAAGAAAQRVTVPAGTRILIRTIDPIDTTKHKTGYRITASLETNLEAEDTVVARRGTTVYGHLAQASSSGKFKGSSQLTLELTDIVINGSAIPLLTSTYEIMG